MTSRRKMARQAADAELYPLAFRFEERFGVCVGVRLAAALEAEPAALRELLDEEERSLCQSMRGARLVEWIGGRVASRLARQGMSGADGPTLRAPSGAPDAGPNASLSISHTRELAVALASTRLGDSVGVDIEISEPEQRDDLLAERILSPAELATRETGGAAVDLAQLLSIKEAAYKAIFSLTATHLSLRHITVRRSGEPDGAFEVALLADGIVAEAASYRFEGHYLSLARARSEPKQAVRRDPRQPLRQKS
jgi:4'-phosphopantetheinyl transferase EntD